MIFQIFNQLTGALILFLFTLGYYTEDPTADQTKLPMKNLGLALKEYSKWITPDQPQTPNVTEDDVNFYVFNKTNTSSTMIHYKDADKIVSLTAFNLSLPTSFVIHGWIGDYNSTVAAELTTALLNLEDRNVIAVYYDRIANEFYLDARACVPAVGSFVGQFILNISRSYNYSLDNIIIVGHSLGAQVGGFAGKATDGQVGSIVALDPAGPFFFEDEFDERLNENDAKYVLAIHTNAQFLGVNYDVGDADFWCNGGLEQPGCVADLFGLCAHERSYKYYIESIWNNQFVGYKCENYTSYENGDCKLNEKANMGGSVLNTTVFGDYFLNTNAASPFARGDVYN